MRICQRSYRCLRKKADFPTEDIIFDCNVVTIATGLPEHNNYGLDSIEAVVEMKKTCPCGSFSVDMNNLFLSFRGGALGGPAPLSIEGQLRQWSRAAHKGLGHQGEVPRCERNPHRRSWQSHRHHQGAHVEALTEYVMRTTDATIGCTRVLLRGHLYNAEGAPRPNSRGGSLYVSDGAPRPNSRGGSLYK